MRAAQILWLAAGLTAPFSGTEFNFSFLSGYCCHFLFASTADREREIAADAPVGWTKKYFSSLKSYSANFKLLIVKLLPKIRGKKERREQERDI
jgi:hypothetical protein